MRLWAWTFAALALGSALIAVLLYIQAALAFIIVGTLIVVLLAAAPVLFAVASRRRDRLHQGPRGGA